MSLFLQPDVSIRVNDGVPVLQREKSSVKRPLNVSEALALTFLSAVGDPDAASLPLSQCLPAGDGDFWVERVVDRFWCYLGGDMARPLDLSWLENIAPGQMMEALQTRREPAPSAVIWVVTLGCNRHCPYCFYDVFGHSAEREDSPPDATFPLEDVVRMIREMSVIGASDLYLTGGEPLLRRDLPRIIEAATDHRVRTHLTTKYAVDSGLARRLSEVGLTDVTFSLDDGRERESTALAGARNFLAEARQAMGAFLEAGITLEVNAVLTSMNSNGLDSLAELLIELGVGRLTLSPYSLPWRAKPAARRLASDTLNVQDQVSWLRERYGQDITIQAGSAAIAEGGETCSETAVCDVGYRDLHVLPSGDVTRCRYLSWREEMVFGSLRDQTILEVWNGRRLKDLNQPPEDRYQGSSCFKCEGFGACNSRGRCYYTALSRSGKLFAQDDFCQLETSS